jgi:hypothetical protein
LRLEWLRTYGGEQYAIELEGVAGGAGHGEVAKMGRVKTAAEEGHPTCVERYAGRFLGR